jgi:hypothetical protein
MGKLCLGIIVAIGSTLPAFGQGVDPIIGTWKFNAEKSTSTGPLARSMILTIARDGQNIVNTNNGVDAQGQAFKLVYQHIYDGMPHPTTGSPDYDSTTYTRIGNTLNAIRFKDGKPVEVSQGIIVPGKTFTVHSEGTTQKGDPYHFTLVYDRQ